MEVVPETLCDYLAAGWSIAGFSTAFSDAGIIFYTVLVRKGASVAAVTVGMNHQSREVVRMTVDLAPIGAMPLVGATRVVAV
jgi:hypothetical protein